MNFCNNGYLLVVEDDFALADVIVEFLWGHGCKCNWAINGQDALQKLKAKDFSCVLVSDRFEGMPLNDFIRKARELRPDVRMIVAAKRPEMLDLEALDECGDYSILRSPIALFELFQAVQTLRERARDQQFTRTIAK